MTQLYYVISPTDSGEGYVVSLTEEKLKERLRTGFYGESVNFLDEHELMMTPEIMHWADSILIIKGEIVEPQPVTVITEYKL